ncbi:hypothetical protein ACFX13_024815 [Malus domestica]|uniref:Uncharacterized protein n=1 Tax=Malus domestica TaxID=3750 RepID=A0A498HFN6_MALDO|nr:hypothetical protein DVH24_028098 [Malus domestica]
MAVSRGLLLLCLGTLLVSVFLVKVAEASEDHGDCHGDPNNGDQCQEHESDVIGDDDVDDTYKIVNKVAVTFSARTGEVEPDAAEASDPDDAEDNESSHIIVMGH